ncbi:DUF1801 domain-containing protein [Nocardia wallacei]|uniref:YdhG-like domain-containing protein n=1 Tax=Nocardia wallacei TaxID=480035 RepID=A0A7G1KHK3_9NOCA|nr:DUF1801 domain-containing protein [Nocardia wallacei]BCK54635.1 hypothetical protein NWFMUON74_24070 [Nocardia wallacei]
MDQDPIKTFLDGLTPQTRPVAERAVAVIATHRRFDAGIRWRQLTFAVDNDFDHWICAVAATANRVSVAFHFGALLDDHRNVFDKATAKFVRRISAESAHDIDGEAIDDLLAQAVTALPRFREATSR